MAPEDVLLLQTKPHLRSRVGHVVALVLDAVVEAPVQARELSSAAAWYQDNQ